MAQLAIKSHATRGKEVIEILKMLGGNEVGYNGVSSACYYYINDRNNIIGVTELPNSRKFVVYSLEQFLEKFPYKIGDEVLNVQGTVMPCQIKGMYWDNDCVKYYCEGTIRKGECFDRTAEQLQPYEELSFGECIEKAINECLFGRDEDTKVKENYSPIKMLPVLDRVMIVPTNEDSEIIEENGKFYLVKKQQQYPKTYEECCGILQVIHTEWHGYLGEVLVPFQKLLICRDAYWKIAGEQMGLGKPWKPDFKDDSDKYFICYVKDEVWKSNIRDCNRLLVFPTAEMRDAFYDNFKELINQCKELL